MMECPLGPAVLLPLLIACTASRVPAQDATTLPPDRLEQIARRFYEAKKLPGLAVGAISGGRVVYRAGLGTTRLGRGRPVTPQTVFHMASITKPFVATAIMQLVEQGQIDLDAPAVRYLPYFRLRDARGAGITVRQLLVHSSGMPDVTDYRWDHPEYDDQALERYIHGLADSTLLAAPGEGWKYSNIGFEVLGDVIAKVSGMPFETYLRERILAPVGMRKSTLLMTDVDSALLAWGHEARSTGVLQPAAHYPYNRRHAASSTLHSNVDDMLRWALVNLNRGTLDRATILPASAYDELWGAQRNITSIAPDEAQADGATVYSRVAVGLSWFVLTRAGRRLVGHSGSDEGFTTDLLLDPERRDVVVVMTNAELDVRPLAVALMDALAYAGRRR